MNKTFYEHKSTQVPEFLNARYKLMKNLVCIHGKYTGAKKSKVKKKILILKVFPSAKFETDILLKYLSSQRFNKYKCPKSCKCQKMQVPKKLQLPKVENIKSEKKYFPY